jgi:hypothetical protein
MSGTGRAIRAAVIILAGALGITGASSAAGAQIRRQPAAQAAQPTPPRPQPQHRVAPVVVGSGAYGARPRIAYGASPVPQLQGPYRQYRRQQRFLPPVVYYPVPSYGYGYGGGYENVYSCGSSVCDVNGNPVMRGFDDPYQNQTMSPAAVPDLSGSPYVGLQGGVISVDFGNGDVRNVPSCAQQSSASTPDGQPRTIFYTPQQDGLILRAGSRGRVIGSPPAGASMCYGLDQYGRVALVY